MVADGASGRLTRVSASGPSPPSIMASTLCTSGVCWGTNARYDLVAADMELLDAIPGSDLMAGFFRR